MFSSLGQQALTYMRDAQQRAILYADVMRQSGDQYVEHVSEDKPPVLVFEHELIVDGRSLPDPVNYGLLRIIPPEDFPVNPTARPFVIIDPRAGHGPGVAGSKIHSEIGVALAAGHPCYFVTFAPYPEPEQSIYCVLKAEKQFLDAVIARHDPAVVGKPFLIGNCQGGWALMMLAAVAPESVGPLMLAGAPLSYWSGKSGQNPMRYSGGMLGGSWLGSYSSDLGNGLFDGAHLVRNFEMLDPANTFWKKPYHLYANVDTEVERYLDFERWWSGHFMMTRQEIDWIVQNLFVGNRLSKAKVRDPLSDGYIDLRNIRSPIVVFASKKDNITPPSQALNWILDLYESDEDLRENEQVLVYCLHETTGHLGIFVSAGVANREHEALVSALEIIEYLPPGLYEARIEDLHPEMPHQQWVEGRHVVSFEPRKLQDLAELDDGREDESAFEVVNRVAQVNQQLYDTTVAPWVRGLSNPWLAQLNRSMTPERFSRYSWSSMNPLALAFLPLANYVKTDRQPVEEGNVFTAAERTIGENMVVAWDMWRDTRDQLVEMTFQNTYGSPWMRALVGLDPAATREKDTLTTETALKNELLALRKQLTLEQVNKGDVADGFARVLSYMVGEDMFIDERVFNMLKQLVRTEINGFTLPPTLELQQKMRQQWRILQMHPQAAIEALPQLIPQAEERERVWRAVAEVAELSNVFHLSEVMQARFFDIACALHLCNEWTAPASVKTNTKSQSIASETAVVTLPAPKKPAAKKPTAKKTSAKKASKAKTRK